jgi:hypothetical protein
VLGGPSLESDSRELQNDLFDQRRDSPPIFRWAYARFRDVDEAAMQHAAEALVVDYERAHGVAPAGVSPVDSGQIGDATSMPTAALPDSARAATK